MEQCIDLGRPPVMSNLRSPLFQEEVQMRDRKEMWDLNICRLIPLQNFWKSSTFEDQAVLASTKQLGPQTH